MHFVIASRRRSNPLLICHSHGDEATRSGGSLPSLRGGVADAAIHPVLSSHGDSLRSFPRRRESSVSSTSDGRDSPRRATFFPDARQERRRRSVPRSIGLPLVGSPRSRRFAGPASQTCLRLRTATPDGGLVRDSPVRAAQGQAVGPAKPRAHPPANLPPLGGAEGACPCYCDDHAMQVRLRNLTRTRPLVRVPYPAISWRRLLYVREIMRKLFLLTVLAVIPMSAHAGCGGGLRGHSSVGEIYIGFGDCDYEEEMIIVRKPQKKASPFPSAERSYKFDNECTRFGTPEDIGTRFVCPASRQSPLAGSEYRIAKARGKQIHCDDPKWPVFRCVRGCNNPSIPKYFEVLPVECI